MNELIVALEFSAVTIERFLPSVLLQPPHRAFLPHGRSEGFIEVFVAPRKHPLMGQFVKQDFGQIGIVVKDKRIQQWILEPTESGISLNPPDKDIVSGFSQ